MSANNADYLAYCDALFEIANAVSKGDIENSFEVVVEQLTKILNIQRCVIAKISEAKGTYRFIAGVAKEGPNHTFGVNYRIADHKVIVRVVETGKPVYCDNPKEDPDLDLIRPFIINSDVRSILFMPVMDGGRVRFVIILDAIREKKCFNDDEIYIVNRIAQIIPSIKALERRVKHQNRLAMTGWMCAAFVHELRNPLVSVGGFSRRLLKSIERAESVDQVDIEELKQYAKIISSHVDRAEAYLKDILDAQWADATVELQEIDLNVLIREILELPEVVLHKEEVLIRFFGRSGLSFMIDAKKFSTAFKNLLFNAIKHARSDTGRAGITISFRLNKRFLGIVIRNPGQLPEPPERVFEPGYTTADGTGFGLTIAQSLIRAQHSDASIIARQDIDKAEFTIYLPFSLMVVKD